MTLWPRVSYANLFNYFVLSECFDGEAMENYKSMESYNYFQSEKVGTVYISVVDGLCLVRADVTPSQAEHRDKHEAWCLLTSSGVVETAGCTCHAGRGRSCSHAGAILWKLEYAASTGRSGSACTDKQQQWNRGTLRNLEPKRLAEINFKRPRRESMPEQGVPVVRAVPDLPETPAFLSHEDFHESVKESDMQPLFKLPGTLLGRCYHSEVSDVQTETRVHGEHSPELTCTLCKTFYEEHVILDNDQINLLRASTKTQAASATWRDARRLRITASSAKKVPVKATTNPDNFVRENLYPSFRGNHATEHGQISEPKAIQALKDMGLSLSAEGTVVSEKEPWLSGSPDGVTEDGKLVEVKCPLIKEDVEQFSDLFKTSFCDVFLQDGKPVLDQKGKRGYYMQVQLTMFCTGLRECIFFVWSDRGHMLVPVHYNEEYVHHHVNRLRNFYFSSMLPRLADDFNAGSLKLCKGYTDIAAK
ncbi:hypothetical protein BaRGS_00013270 [Batillaria attramentaria]|uniref:YqaJ viral recombinase domain-containing protein n=1 Tax=Batillaria attramentaria TaxID=370345 RepID=A0ABD0L7Z8_9CAEN